MTMSGMAADPMGSVSLDFYSFWTLSEGGVPLESAMPAYKDSLTERERWLIIRFMSNGFKAGG